MQIGPYIASSATVSYGIITKGATLKRLGKVLAASVGISEFTVQRIAHLITATVNGNATATSYIDINSEIDSIEKYLEYENLRNTENKLKEETSL
mgnify:CR=1 FL=1